ncbi:MAG TPA: hypothetical protein PKJ37_12905 [Acidobacteriota bacterium]|nr:hypothetical protein [Acidobacteriota bacterium]HNT18774.1 hypothetical protein [Acidobacteriota bacterium]
MFLACFFKRLPLIFFLLAIISSSTHADDAIVYLNYNSELIAIYGPQKERVVIDQQIDCLSVSPDGRFIVAFRAGCLNDENCKAHVYNLATATSETVFLPFGEWGRCWWSADSSRIYVVRALRQKDRGPACKDEDQFGCWANAIVQFAVYDLAKKTFCIEKEFEPCSNWTMLDLYKKEHNYNPPPPGDIVSPDGKWRLSWGKEKIEWDWSKPEIVLVNTLTGIEKKIWVEQTCDFCAGVRVSHHPWSKDSMHIVLTKIPGGFLRWVFGIGTETTVYSVDITSLKWTELDKGVDAHWFLDFPRSFQKVDYSNCAN